MNLRTIAIAAVAMIGATSAHAPTTISNGTVLSAHCSPPW